MHFKMTQDRANKVCKSEMTCPHIKLQIRTRTMRQGLARGREQCTGQATCQALSRGPSQGRWGADATTTTEDATV